MSHRASFGARAMAAILDVVIIGTLALACGAILATVFGGVVASAMAMCTHVAGALGLAAIVTTLAGIFFTILLLWLIKIPYDLIECFTGWTPGKLALGLRVVSADGSPASTGQLVGRWFARNVGTFLGMLTFVTALPFVALTGPLQGIVFLGCFLVLLPDRQALHDMLSQTSVVHAEPGGDQPTPSGL